MTNVKNNTLNATLSARPAQIAAKASGNGLRVSTNTKAGRYHMSWRNRIKFIRKKSS